jgi:sulfatase maturation enzyme AslB (radical SAM superfamily)
MVHSPFTRPQCFRPTGTGSIPIFRKDQAEYALFYAPGYLAVVEDNQADAFEENAVSSSPEKWSAVDELRRHALTARDTWKEIFDKPFAPICLKLYLNNQCNLACTYCYSSPSPRRSARLSLSSVSAAAEIVSDNCSKTDQPVNLVFHGGGEPTLDRALGDAILDSIETLAESKGLPMFRYIATNVIMSVEKAKWVANRFDLVGLSCDGPEDIQARQRPLVNGGSSTGPVERTARIVHEMGKPLNVRTTITLDSVDRQSEIAEYICRELKPSEIHIEPVFLGGRMKTSADLPVRHAETFVREFLKGRAVARLHGARWLTSGSRPETIHGLYCNTLCGVLNLVPGGVATACFKTVDAEQTEAQSMRIGQEDIAAADFVLDHRKINVLRTAVRATPSKCLSCFNQYHCSRGCPDLCPLNSNTQNEDFRCLVQQKLMGAYLRENGQWLFESMEPGAGVNGKALTESCRS